MINLILIVILIWLMNSLLCWVGVVRHSYRAYHARTDVGTISRQKRNGILRYAANLAWVGECCRTFTKLGMLLFCVLTLARLLDRAPETWYLLDARDVIAPLVFMMWALVLTGWSDWENWRRPRP